MIQALKGAFMGYIGLLLNAPYKIDSMVWMRMMLMWFVLRMTETSLLVINRLNEPQGKMDKKALKCR
jgi:hypothetical protein